MAWQFMHLTDVFIQWDFQSVQMPQLSYHQEGANNKEFISFLREVQDVFAKEVFYIQSVK